MAEEQLAGMDEEGLRKLLGELLASNRATQANFDEIRQQFPIQPSNLSNETPSWAELEEGGLEPPEPEEGEEREGESFAEQLAPQLEELLELPPPTLWAVVSSAGKLARKRGATKAEKLEEFTGTYWVFFETDVTDCAYEATIARPGHEGSEDPGFITVTRLFEHTDALQIQTYNAEGLLQDRGFHLTVNF